MIVLIDILYIIKENFKSSLIFIILYIVMLLISSINIRFNYYYQCDDYKGIYNYFKTSELNESKYVSNYDTSIYNLEDILKEKYYNADKLSDNKIIKLFQEHNDYTLILFEKNSSEKLYNYFDNNKEYKINDNFNSFKIIEHGKGEV